MVPRAKIAAAGLKASYHKPIKPSLAKASSPARPTPREQEEEEEGLTVRNGSRLAQEIK